MSSGGSESETEEVDGAGPGGEKRARRSRHGSKAKQARRKQGVQLGHRAVQGQPEQGEQDEQEQRRKRRQRRRNEPSRTSGKARKQEHGKQRPVDTMFIETVLNWSVMPSPVRAEYDPQNIAGACSEVIQSTLAGAQLPRPDMNLPPAVENGFEEGS